MQPEGIGVGRPASFHGSQCGVSSMPWGGGMGTLREPARSLLVLSALLELDGFDLTVSVLSPDVTGRTLPDEYLEVIASRGPELNDTRACIKPFGYCRHILPATDAVVGMMATTSVQADVITDVRSGTYVIAAKHARDGWGDMTPTHLRIELCVARPMRHGKAIALPVPEDGHSRAETETLLGAHIATRAVDAISCLLTAAAQG